MTAADDAELSAFRLADSFLPIGTYTVSYGLEQFVQSGRVNDADELAALLDTYLARHLAAGELVALRGAHAGAVAADVAAICTADRRLTAATTAAEFRESARAAGDRLLALQTDLDDDPVVSAYASAVEDGDAPGTHAAALGAIAAREGIEEREACLVCCHGFVTGLLGVAQRLLSLGHTDAQRILRERRPAISAAVADSASRDLADIAPFAPLVDVLAADHERADRRLFVS